VDASGNAYVTGTTESGDFPTTPGAFQTTCGGGAFVTKLNADGSALLYSTYLCGGGGYSIAVDGSGNAYITGWAGPGFPTTPGAFQPMFHFGGEDAFVTKLNAAGSALLYSTYLGGSDADGGYGIAIDESGNAYVTGFALSLDFPTTPGAFQTARRGGSDAFVSKLNSTGSALVYSTYLGGSDSEDGPYGYGSIAVDVSDNAYVTGNTSSSNFPTTPGAFHTTLVGCCPDAFVTKLNAAGSAPVYSTYLGGSIDYGTGIAVDASGNAYITGDAAQSIPTTPGAFQTTCARGGGAFVSKFNATGSALVYSTYLCGGGGYSIAVDGSGNAYIAGTAGPGFPTTPGAFQTTYRRGGDAFVSKLNAAGSALHYSTYLGGSGRDSGGGVAVDASGNVYVAGQSSSSDFPTTPGAFQTTFAGGTAFGGDAFVSKFSFVAAPVSLTPASVSFLLLRTVGTTSLPQTVKLTNVGSGELEITGITVTGPSAGDFFQSNNCPAAVAAGASCLITVAFTPTGQGVRTASVSIAYNAPGSPQTVPLTGRGTFLKWVPRQTYMGEEPVGTASPAQTVTLTNVGTAPIAIFSIGIEGVNAGDFSETYTCGTSLKAGASCTIQVTFTPTAVGSRLGHVAIRDNAFGGTHWVGLLGKGT
jgi:hypothetical protein